MGAKRCLHYKKKDTSQLFVPSENTSVNADTFQICDQQFKPPIHYAPSSWSGRLRSRNFQHLPDGRKLMECNTSDYGTSSESSRKSSLIISEEDTCDWERESGVSSLPATPLTSDIESEGGEEHLSVTPWSDLESETQNAKFDDIIEDYEINQTFQNLKENGIPVKLLHRDGVAVLVPNSSPTDNNDLSLQIHRSNNYKPYSSVGTIHASLVVSLEPHGTQFFGKLPAVIFLPLLVLPGPTDKIECLYSNTSPGSQPVWEKLSDDQFHLSCNKVIISTHHFSLFTVVMRPETVESCRLIRQRSGGRLRNAAAPGTEINFPRGSLQNDIVASVKVIFQDTCEPWQWRALASPIVMVGPHGYQFAINQPPVTVRLPLPDYMKICRQFPARLTVWQSNTSENQAAFWEKLDVDIRIERDPISRCYTATFPVYHFSFFKIMWDILSTSLFEAKMGMSHFYPFISFSMMCQAFMEENADSSRFGLEVICHRSDRRLPELTNYKHRVGASLKPKLVKPGKILVRLKSQLFEADIDAGEDPEMVKQEYDFRGRDFEKQYACRFKTDIVIARGTFGKVVVERLVTGGTGLEPIFEFNLHKTGNENEATAPECSDRWSIVAIKELAGTLRILDDQNWKTLARYIGFTRNEIKTKLQYSPDPFLSMMNMYQARGGSPEEFLQALYAVSRELQISGTLTSPLRGGSQSGSSQGGSSPTGSHSSQFSNSPIRKSIWSSLAPWRSNKDEDSDTSGTRSTQVMRKRNHPGAEVTSHSSSKGKDCSSQHQSGGSSSAKRSRRKYSDVSETVTSASSASENDDITEPVEGKSNVRKVHRKVVHVTRKIAPKSANSDDECSTEKCKLDPRMLSDGDLWRVSSSMNNINWRALGRTLGLQESALVNIESSYRSAGCRECAYQMMLEWKGLKPKQCTVGSLFSGLTKENMNEVAKKMAAIEFGVHE